MVKFKLLFVRDNQITPNLRVLYNIVECSAVYASTPFVALRKFARYLEAQGYYVVYTATDVYKICVQIDGKWRNFTLYECVGLKKISCSE